MKFIIYFQKMVGLTGEVYLLFCIGFDYIFGLLHYVTNLIMISETMSLTSSEEGETAVYPSPL